MCWCFKALLFDQGIFDVLTFHLNDLPRLDEIERKLYLLHDPRWLYYKRFCVDGQHAIHIAKKHICEESIAYHN
jgi:hypothetical protein